LSHFLDGPCGKNGLESGRKSGVAQSPQIVWRGSFLIRPFSLPVFSVLQLSRRLCDKPHNLFLTLFLKNAVPQIRQTAPAQRRP